MSPAVERIGVAGAGTMGAGIAALSALSEFEAVLHDPDPEALERGIARLRSDLERGAERGRWSAEQAAAAIPRVRAAEGLADFAECGLVIEAAPERLELKRELFGGLEAVCAPAAVLATNTSSLSVAEIAATSARPERICGMHFFNPPALMRLVEVVAAPASGERALATVGAVAERMGRTPVRCADSPGFIVNRCNRPYSLESLQMLGEGIASHEQIDLVMREDGGYRMGPFELIDLIGVDVNLEVARSFYRQRPLARWRPHPIQERLVAEGRLGRKSGRGFYEYEGGHERPAADPPPPAVRAEILDRVVAALVNEASFAVAESVAAPADIDTAMRLGLNHPKGPFEWLAERGGAAIVATLEHLAERDHAGRYALAPGLREGVTG